jgi:hypothetical protein
MPERLLVKRFDFKKTLPASGANQEKVIYLADLERASGETKTAEVWRLPTSPVVAPSTMIEGDLVAEGQGWRLKGMKVIGAESAPQANGSSSPAAPSGPPDADTGVRYGFVTHPVEVQQRAERDAPRQRAIVREHSQEMSLRYWDLALRVGKLTPEQFSLAAVLECAKRFDEDVLAQS